MRGRARQVVRAAGVRGARRGVLLGALLSALPSGCAPPGAAGGVAAIRSGGLSARDEKVLVASYPTVEAIAVSRRHVFAVASGALGAGGGPPGGVLVYDRVRAQWLPPLGMADGLGMLPVRAIAADPLDDALWIGLPGQLRIYRPITDQWVQLPITGTPELIAFERPGGAGGLGGLSTGDAWVRAAGAWLRVSRVGMAFPADRPPASGALLLPPSMSALAAQFPALRALGGTVPVARRANRPLQSASIVAAAAVPDRAAELWVGTAGAGLFEVDAFTGRAVARPFGLLAPGAGALAPALGGVWVAGAGSPSARAGLTFVSASLQQWRWIDGTITVPLEGVPVRALATRGNVAWLGTDRGVVRVTLDGDEGMTRWTALDGLPDDRVLAVAPRPDGCWVGTMRGLAFVADSGGARTGRAVTARWLSNQPVWALQADGERLWIGAEAGLFVRPAAAGGAEPVQGVDVTGRRPVRALAAVDSLLLVATDDQLLPIAASAPAARAASPAIPVDLRGIGRVLRMAADGRAAFVGGTEGVLAWDRHGGGVRRLAVPGDLPGPALDLLATDAWLWVGTPAGLLRLRRAPDGALWP